MQRIVLLSILSILLLSEEAKPAPQGTQAQQGTQASTKTQAPQETLAPQGTQAPQSPQGKLAPQETQAPQAPQGPKATQAPQAPKATQAPQAPKATQAPQAPKATQAPQAPMTTQAPQGKLAPQGTETPQGPQGRIYGGYQVDNQRAPYMAQVVVLHSEPVPGATIDAEDCGGSILRTNLILTAGHCIKDFKTGEEFGPDRYYVYVGSNLKQGGDMHTVKKVHLHPKYDGPSSHYYHDVALLQLTDHITLDHSKELVTIAEKSDKTKSGDDVYVSGWGENPDHPNDNRLYQVFLKVMTAKKCHDEVGGGEVEEIEEHNICVGGKKKGHCQGDSGGPLISSSLKRQVGIVSWGTRDCTNSKPRYYTKVTDNLDFIDSVISEADDSDDDSSSDGKSPVRDTNSPCRAKAPVRDTNSPCRAKGPVRDTNSPCRAKGPVRDTNSPCRAKGPVRDTNSPCRAKAPVRDTSSPCSGKAPIRGSSGGRAPVRDPNSSSGGRAPVRDTSSSSGGREPYRVPL